MGKKIADEDQNEDEDEDKNKDEEVVESSRIAIDPGSMAPLDSDYGSLEDPAKSYRTEESAHSARGKATKSASSSRVPIGEKRRVVTVIAVRRAAARERE